MQILIDRQAIVDTVHEFCRALDLRDWTGLRRLLAENLATDYSSFRGTPPTRMTSDQFIALRQTGLAGLVTQHLSFNHLVEFEDGHASCHFDFIIHRWPEDTADPRFFHTFGWYEFVLHRSQGVRHGWCIVSIVQHALRSEGSAELHGDPGPAAKQLASPATKQHFL